MAQVYPFNGVARSIFVEAMVMVFDESEPQRK